jgi:hypothetical protein
MATTPLQQSPRGLLQLLNAKVGGQNPDAIELAVQPTVDASSMYGMPWLVTLNTTATVQNYGDMVTVGPVPANELWRVRSISAAINDLNLTNQSHSGGVGICLSPIVLLNNIQFFSSDRFNALSAPIQSSIFAWEGDEWAPGGSTIVFFYTGPSIPTTPSNCYVTARVERMPA